MSANKRRSQSLKVRADRVRQSNTDAIIRSIDQKSKKASKKTTRESKQSNSPDTPTKPDPYKRMLRKLDSDIAARKGARPK